MQKFIQFTIALYLLSVDVLALPQHLPLTTTTPFPVIINQVGTTNADGSYNSSYETSNGIKVENSGYLKKIVVTPQEGPSGGQDQEVWVMVQQGSFSYSDPNGNIITVRYVADENGFHPEGDHLPQSSNQSN